MKTESLTPVVQRALVQLGQTIRIARKKRRMNVEDFADRLGVTKGTVIRLERGEAGVSIGTLAMAMLALGELRRLGELIDMASDETGLLLDVANLPKRINRPRKIGEGEVPDASGSVDPRGMAF